MFRSKISEGNKGSQAGGYLYWVTGSGQVQAKGWMGVHLP